MVQAYCVKCNRNNPKGEWQQTELKDAEIRQLETKRGTKFQTRGICLVCGNTVTMMIAKPK